MNPFTHAHSFETPDARCEVFTVVNIQVLWVVT